MAELLPVTYTHALADAISIRAKSYLVRYMEPGKEVYHRPGHLGKAIDPDKAYQVLICTAKIETDDYETIEGWIMDGPPTYDATYPNVSWQVDGTTPKSMLCQLQKPLKRHKSDNKWIVTLTFEQRGA